MTNRIAMTITGQEIEAGVRDWIRDELKNGPAKEYDLGKFFLSVATGTLGFLFVAEKLTNTPAWDFKLVFSFIVLVLSMILSLYMVVPKNWSITDTTDLFERRDSIIRRIVMQAYAWFAFWLVGTGFGVWAVLR